MVNKKLIISKDDLKFNIETLQSKINSKIIAVLKGDGYGLGLINMANLLKESGIDFYAVSEAEEAVRLRSAGIDGKILLLTPQYKKNIVGELVKNKITLTVDSLETAEIYNKVCEELNEELDAHIKIDTGFGRFGFTFDNKEEVVKALRIKKINYSGMYSHFSCAFEKKFKITKVQFEKFLEMVSYLESFDFKFEILHIANSSAAIQFPETHLDAVRLGSALLGRLPVYNKYGLKKIAYLESEVLSVRTLNSDHNIGYGNTYKTKGVTEIAIIPVGYKDGFMTEKSPDTFRIRDILRSIYANIRSFGKKNFVEINDKSVRIIGRVGMYNTVVDVTGCKVEKGDKVKLNINPLLLNSNIEKEYR